MENELLEQKTSLDAVNSILLEKGFKRGDIKDAEQQAKEAKTAIKKTEPTTEENSIVKTNEAKKDPEIKQEKSTGYQGGEPENVIPLKTINDESLAIIYIEKDSIHILPDESKRFSVNTPPFSNFLVERVLTKMQDKDAELVRMKQLPQEKMFSYNIVREADLIREIIIRNVNEDRFKEIKSSVRWTLEKMNEKMSMPQ
ncbi:MAG: hypothetical protein GX638_05600 [Crenarchaeota archaeon]|nr:hypothetical protein [Thermoproteota archaeon]